MLYQRVRSWKYQFPMEAMASFNTTRWCLRTAQYLGSHQKAFCNSRIHFVHIYMYMYYMILIDIMYIYIYIVVDLFWILHGFTMGYPSTALDRCGVWPAPSHWPRWQQSRRAGSSPWECRPEDGWWLPMTRPWKITTLQAMEIGESPGWIYVSLFPWQCRLCWITGRGLWLERYTHGCVRK